MSVDIATYVHDLAIEAKAASGALATASDAQRQEAVRAMAAALRDGVIPSWPPTGSICPRARCGDLGGASTACC